MHTDRAQNFGDDGGGEAGGGGVEGGEGQPGLGPGGGQAPARPALASLQSGQRQAGERPAACSSPQHRLHHTRDGRQHGELLQEQQSARPPADDAALLS